MTTEDKEESQKQISGEVVFAGSTNFERVGRGGDKASDGLMAPHRLKGLAGIPISKVFSGPAAAHSVALTPDGKVFTWGRGEAGQLGLGDTSVRNMPTEVKDLASHRVVSAACGRGHTVFVTDKGTVYAVGLNTSGQLGQGNTKSPVTKPAALVRGGIAAHKIDKVACGAEFTMLLTSKGSLHACGHPEYGQLGNGSDGKFFVSASKLSFNFKSDPIAIAAFNDPANALVDVQCGNNHTVALGKNKHVWTWGFGGFGRLGHNDAKDVALPKAVEMFKRPQYGATFIRAGGSASFAITELNQLYMWGITKKSGEANVYPKPVTDLSGWNIRSLSCGPTSCACAADDKCITWGPSPTYGELAYGDGKPKSSTIPKIAEPFDPMYVEMVASGYGHALFLVRRETDEDKKAVDALPLYEPEDDAVVEEPPAKKAKKAPTKVPTKVKGAAKGKKK